MGRNGQGCEPAVRRHPSARRRHPHDDRRMEARTASPSSSQLRRITSRFALLLTAAGILPLVVYGAISIYSLRDATRRSVIAGNENVARRVAEQIGLYVRTNINILQSVAANLENTSL